MRTFILLAIILLLACLSRFFHFQTLPGEWFGDISNVHEYTQQVLTGVWPFYFFQSPGPLYHYAIAPIAYLYRNHGYETYKLASIIISLLGLFTTYLFVRELVNRRLALITSAVMAVSYVYLIWSRLGNSQIIIPALSSFMGYSLIRYAKSRKLRWGIIGAVCASLGWYTYPQTFIFPFAYIPVFTVIWIKNSRTNRTKDSRLSKHSISSFRPHLNLVWHLPVVVLILFLLIIPFIFIVRSQPDNFGPKGYVGEKVVPGLSLSPIVIVNRTLERYGKIITMLHVRGDDTFRINVKNHPHLDTISGLLLFGGLLFFLSRKRRSAGLFILWMLIVLPLPSISPAVLESEIPNTGRTIALLPYIYLLVSAGFLWIYDKSTGLFKINQWYAVGFLTFVFAALVYENLILYFVSYRDGLPDNNLAPGRLIARYVDALPPEINLYFSSCCWGQWGAPDPKGVAYNLHAIRYSDFSVQIKGCSEITHFPALVMTDPKRDDLLDTFQACSPNTEVRELRNGDGTLISKFVLVRQVAL